MPKVVLVDDEIWALRGLQALLADHPRYEVAATFLDGAEALNYLRRNPCDLVFTDLRMGRMGGRELISRCLSDGIPARMVIISAYSDFEAAREGLQSGVLDYLLKPITREDVASLVARLDVSLGDEHKQRSFSALRREVETAYPECRVICYRPQDQNAKERIAAVKQTACALRASGVREDGFAVLLLSTPVNRIPPEISALPSDVGISRPRRDFSAFADMCAEARQSARCAFRFVQSKPASTIQSYIAAHYKAPLTLDALAAHFFMNKSYLCSIFREECGMTVMTFLKHIRSRMAASLLLETNESVQEIALQVGYSDSAYFSRVFKNAYGLSPEAYRREKHPRRGTEF